MSVSFDLTGRTALVTGANTGLGQAIAVGLAGAGADIVAVGRSAPTETEAAVRALGRGFKAIGADLSSIAPIAVSMGVPVAPLGLLVAVETFPDIFRTLGNVTADMAVTRMVQGGEVEDAPEAG